MKCRYCGTKYSSKNSKCPKCGRQNGNHLNMNRKKVIIVAAAIAIVATVVTAMAVSFTGGSDPEISVMNNKTGEYMMVNAPADLSLDIDLEKADDTSSLQVYDITGNKIDTNDSLSGKSLRIDAPDEGYSKGQIYTLDLGGKGSFHRKDLKDARKLMFIVDQKNKSVVEFKDGVEQLGSRKVSKQDEKLVIRGRYHSGDIVVADVDNDDIEEIYKLKNAVISHGTTTAGYEEPNEDEVYEKLEVFYYDNVDLSKAEVNKENVGKMLEESGIMDAFTEEVYADDGSSDSSFEAGFDGSKDFKITIKDPKNKKRKLVITIGVEDKVLLKCSKDEGVFFLNNTLTVAGGFDFSISGENKAAVERKVQDALEDYFGDKDRDVSACLMEKNMVKVSTSVPGVPFIRVYSDIGVFADMAMSASFNTGMNAEMSFSSGVIFDYRNVKVIKKYTGATFDYNAYMIVKGKFDAFAGLSMEMGAKVPAIIRAGVEVRGGPYLESQGCFSMTGIPKDFKAEGYYKIVIGMKCQGDLKYKLPLSDEEKKTLVEMKKPYVTYGRYLDLLDTSIVKQYYLDSSGIYIGDLKAEYKDRIKGKEVWKDIDKYQLYLDSDEVRLNDGYITGQLSPGKHKIKVTWKEDGEKFEKEKSVKVIDFDPFSAFEKVNMIGKSFGYIERNYGEFSSTLDLELERVQWFSEKLACWYEFYGTCYDVADDSICYYVTGTMENVLGLKHEISKSELENILGRDSDMVVLNAEGSPASSSDNGEEITFYFNFNVGTECYMGRIITDNFNIIDPDDPVCIYSNGCC